jgi:hypothetical protein
MAQRPLTKSRFGTLTRVDESEWLRELNTTSEQRRDRMVQSAKVAVMSYIKAMGDRDYAAARKYLGDNVRVKGRQEKRFAARMSF